MAEPLGRIRGGPQLNPKGLGEHAVVSLGKAIEIPQTLAVAHDLQHRHHPSFSGRSDARPLRAHQRPNPAGRQPDQQQSDQDGSGATSRQAASVGELKSDRQQS